MIGVQEGQAPEIFRKLDHPSSRRAARAVTPSCFTRTDQATSPAFLEVADEIDDRVRLLLADLATRSSTRGWLADPTGRSSIGA
jgi:hypothetical protein